MGSPDISDGSEIFPVYFSWVSEVCLIYLCFTSEIFLMDYRWVSEICLIVPEIFLRYFRYVSDRFLTDF